MKQFARLFSCLDESNKEDVKVEALIQYFKQARDEDKIWVIFILTGNRPSRIVTTTNLQTWTSQVTGYSDWMINESLKVVGDIVETCTLLVSTPPIDSGKTLPTWLNIITQLKDQSTVEIEHAIKKAWTGLTERERLIFNKLITGTFRVEVTRRFLVKALASVVNKKEQHVAQRLSSKWKPDKTSFKELLIEENSLDLVCEYFPFVALEEIQSREEVSALGSIDKWLIERVWPGHRCQMVLRKGNIFLWSEKGELLTKRFPEFMHLAKVKEEMVLEGMIVVWDKDGKPSHSLLQKRLSRKTATKKVLKDLPASFISRDILEFNKKELTLKTTKERQKILEVIIQDINYPELLLSEVLPISSWEDAQEEVNKIHSIKSEALLLREKSKAFSLNNPYWIWKAEKHSAKAVLLYATRGDDGPSNYTDITLGVWTKEDLVPLVKVDFDLDALSKAEISSFINKNTVERFGPVRVVRPTIVFEIIYEAVDHSTRRKSGLSLRKPQLVSWLKDQDVDTISTLEDIKRNI